MYRQLEEVRTGLERHYRDMQDLEFTVQHGDLYLLQTRSGKRTGAAAVTIAVDMVSEGLISRQEAIERVEPQQIDQLLHPGIDPARRGELGEPVATGLNASPGAATGRAVFTADEAEEWTARGERTLLVRRETSPEDIGGMVAAQGILTSTGGMTSHAAVVARGMGTPCVAGCTALAITAKTASVGPVRFGEGDWVTIDGSTGEVFLGEAPLTEPEISGTLAEFLSWTDEVRTRVQLAGQPRGFGVRTNADLPRDAQTAREFGAEGIGLCRTEHMFFDEGKLAIFQEDDRGGGRRGAAAGARPAAAAAARGLPRHLPGHVGLSRDRAAARSAAARVRARGRRKTWSSFRLQKTGVPLERLQARIHSLHEQNPMLGHRGCRLGITYPEIYDMQVRPSWRQPARRRPRASRCFPRS